MFGCGILQGMSRSNVFYELSAPFLPTFEAKTATGSTACLRRYHVSKVCGEV